MNYRCDNGQQASHGAEAALPCLLYVCTPGNKAARQPTARRWPVARSLTSVGPRHCHEPRRGRHITLAGLGQQQPARRYCEPGNQSIWWQAAANLALEPRAWMRRWRNILYATGRRQVHIICCNGWRVILLPETASAECLNHYLNHPTKSDKHLAKTLSSMIIDKESSTNCTLTTAFMRVFFSGLDNYKSVCIDNGFNVDRLDFYT